MDKKPCYTPSSSSSSSSSSSAYPVFQPIWTDPPSPLATPQAGSSSSAGSLILVLPELGIDTLNALNERAYQFFQSAKLSYNVNYGRFCDHTGLGRKNRKPLGLDGNMCFDFWKQWLYIVSVGSEYPSVVQDAAQEARVKLLMKICPPYSH